MPQDNRQNYATTITIYSDEPIGKEFGKDIALSLDKWLGGADGLMLSHYSDCVPCNISDMPTGIRREMRNWDRRLSRYEREAMKEDWDLGVKDEVPQGFTFRDWVATGFTDDLKEMHKYLLEKEDFMANVGKEGENASN